MVQVAFTYAATDEFPEFSDALYFSDAEYNLLTEEDIQAFKEERYETWKIAVKTPPPEEPLPDDGEE